MSDSAPPTPPSPPSHAGTIDVAGPVIQPTVGREHTRVRPWITRGLLLAFCVEAAAGLIIIFGSYSSVADYQAHVEAMKDMMAVVFVPTVTLLGSAMGFYFGEARNKTEE